MIASPIYEIQAWRVSSRAIAADISAMKPTATVSPKQLRELHIRLNLPEKS